LVNAHTLKKELEEAGSIFQTTMDSEILLHLIVKNLKHGFEEALVKTVERLKGAFSFVVLTNKGEIIGIKDPNGFRPLCLGIVNGSYILASESCALDLVQAELIRELDPGEIVIISNDGVKSIKPPLKHHNLFAFLNLSILLDLIVPFLEKTYI
jgi:amidophosphoribosyltransferase